MAMLIDKICRQCGKQLHAGKVYCSRSCYNQNRSTMPNSGWFKSGSKHRNWHGGIKVVTAGNKSTKYIKVKAPGHPMADGNGYIPKHRLVMSEHLGRLLKHNEVVHHRDGNGFNNDLKNLQLMTKTEHNLMHKAMRKKGFICACGSEQYFAYNMCEKCYGRERYRLRSHYYERNSLPKFKWSSLYHGKRTT